MERTFIEPVRFLTMSELIGGEIEDFSNPNGASKGRRTRRGRIVRLEEKKEYIRFHCEWIAKINDEEKVTWRSVITWSYVKTKKLYFDIHKLQPAYEVNKWHEQGDGSFCQNSWAPFPTPYVMYSATVYPKGNKSLLDTLHIRGL